MAEQPDFAALARQYLDLWEDQLTLMAADPDLAEQSARFFDAMTQLGKDVNPMLSANLAEFLQQTQTGKANETDPTTPGTDRAKTRAAASDDRKKTARATGSRKSENAWTLSKSRWKKTHQRQTHESLMTAIHSLQR